MKLSKGIRRGERVVLATGWVTITIFMHFCVLSTMNVPRNSSLKYGSNLPHRDVENQWFPLENDVQMVAFPHPC